MTTAATVRHTDEAERVVWSDTRGHISFRTLIGDGTTSTKHLCSGVAHLEPGGWLSLHRHAAAEVYQVLTGEGVVTVDGADHTVRAGSGVHIPSNLEHGIRNTGGSPLEFVYVYATDSIAEVDYVWS